ncbi:MULTISPECIES: LysR family transcriptional regulator [Franconibacter]|uniref:LysR family transcriptional regulator n=1 Tax=Franconibacter daqui TaxID=2047724 RepID=A0ABV1PME5_9ENTR|nr:MULTISPECIES: LysR family transcriptional regulator [Franconibacter]MCK1968321.1 LysR family transcriptional regulator [Franconibacter sp. IITDAS19]MEB5922446.1 LysR family transcriptional regulator [Franconibacter daqui]
MDKLESMKVYVSVVDTQSFARAAEVLGLPRSTVSRVIKELESWLGIQLLQRTTRKLSVTADGRTYYEECRRILTDIATMESSFPGLSSQPKGRFKVGMPQSLARHCFIPRLQSFLRQYPELELMLCSSDNVEDIIQEGYDCVIRTGRIEDSTTLVARPLANFKWAVLASPNYLDAHGKPETLDELERHRAVGYLNHRTGRTTEWFFTLEEGDRAIRMKETLVVDDTDAYIQAGIAGIGLIRAASYLVAPYLKSGELVACLDNYAFDLPLSLVYPQTRYLPPAVRAFYDWSRTVLNQPVAHEVRE